MSSAVVYGRDEPFCKYCVMAKELLSRKAIPFEYVRVGVDITANQLLEIVPGAKTLPQIFMDGEYVGGFDSLAKRFSV
jgi:glutaredoxin 3